MELLQLHQLKDQHSNGVSLPMCGHSSPETIKFPGGFLVVEIYKLLILIVKLISCLWLSGIKRLELRNALALVKLEQFLYKNHIRN